jgi:hypothetical protein
MFDYPSFTFGAVAYAAIGSMVFWGKMGRTKLKAYVLSDVLDRLPVRPNTQYLIEFFIFVILGCVVGIGITQPTNARQAITAGIAWTGIFSAPRSTRKPSG